jgi:hypothetical protein
LDRKVGSEKLSAGEAMREGLLDWPPTTARR